MKKLLGLMALFVISLLTLSLVSALDEETLQMVEFEVNGDDLPIDLVGESGEMVAVEEGETLEVKVVLRNAGDTEIRDIEVRADISGFEFGDLSASSSLFDLAAGTRKTVRLELELPPELEHAEYWLRVRVSDKNTPALNQEVRLHVEPKRHALGIADVSFSPGNTVRAGRSLLATVLLENFGEKDQKDVKVVVSIPELGVSATEFVDVLRTDNENFDFEDVPEMFLPIPATAADGDYEVKVTVQYQDFRKTVTATRTVQVVADERFQPVAEQDRLVLAVGPETQSVAAGASVQYGVALTNAGPRSTAYVLEAAAGDWAAVSLSESLVVLEPGRNKVVYVTVQPTAAAAAGEHVLSLNVKSASGDVLQTVPLRATVTSAAQGGAQDVSLRNGLEIALIVLVVLLVIVGLVIGFSRLRKGGEEEQTYY